MATKRYKSHIKVLGLCAFLWPITVFAQDKVILTGVVQDESHAAVAGAKIALVEQKSSQTFETTSAASGAFGFLGLSPGDYVLKADASGFEPYEEILTVATLETKPFTIRLKVGSVKAQVTVTLDDEEEVNTSNSNTTSLRISDNVLAALPADAEDILPLLDRFILPGTQGTEGTTVLVDGIEAGQTDMPAAAISRIRINRNPYSAAFQSPGTGRVEISTRRGHKSYYEGSFAISARNSLFDARNAFATSAPDTDRRLVQAKLGGPLPGRQSSFYIAAERLMDNETAVVNAVTLSGPFMANVPTRERRYRTFSRVQWWPTDLHTVFVTYDFKDKSRENDKVGGFNLPEQGIRTTEYGHKLALKDSVLLSGNTRNELLFTFQNEDQRTGSPAVAPAIVVKEAFTSGPSQSFGVEKKQTFDGEDTITRFRGKHSFVLGGRVRTDSIDAVDASNFGGTFEFSSLSLFAAGTPYVFRLTQGDSRVAFPVRSSSGFVQDEVRVSQTLNLTFGLRHSWQSITDDRNNFAPRFAFAFAPGRQTKTVWRGGAGLFYDDLPRAARRRSLLLDGVRLRELVISHPSYPNPFLSGRPTSVLPSIIRVAPDIRSPYLLHTSAGVERELRDRNSVSLEYMFVRGAKLFRSRNINAPLPETTLRPDPNFLNIDRIESTAFQRTHALTASFNGRFGKFSRSIAKYVFSKSTDDTSGTFSLPADNYNLRAEAGPSDFDRRHRFNLMQVLELGRGYQLGAVFSTASGAPFNITTGFDQNGDTLANDRPFGVTRNTGRGPGTMQLDLRIKKVFLVSRLWSEDTRRGKQHLLQFTLDAFNVTNHTNVTHMVGVLTSPFYGHANSADTARRFQVSLNYEFPN
jgi:carboxypeptidase family protein